MHSPQVARKACQISTRGKDDQIGRKNDQIGRMSNAFLSSPRRLFFSIRATRCSIAIRTTGSRPGQPASALFVTERSLRACFGRKRHSRIFEMDIKLGNRGDSTSASVAHCSNGACDMSHENLRRLFRNAGEERKVARVSMGAKASFCFVAHGGCKRRLHRTSLFLVSRSTRSSRSDLRGEGSLATWSHNILRSIKMHL